MVHPINHTTRINHNLRQLTADYRNAGHTSTAKGKKGKKGKGGASRSGTPPPRDTRETETKPQEGLESAATLAARWDGRGS
jgi:hypothetical protein